MRLLRCVACGVGRKQDGHWTLDLAKATRAGNFISRGHHGSFFCARAKGALAMVLAGSSPTKVNRISIANAHIALISDLRIRTDQAGPKCKVQ